MVCFIGCDMINHDCHGHYDLNVQWLEKVPIYELSLPMSSA